MDGRVRVHCGHGWYDYTINGTLERKRMNEVYGAVDAGFKRFVTLLYAQDFAGARVAWWMRRISLRASSLVGFSSEEKLPSERSSETAWQ
jgi:hypothetical protein